MYTLSSSYLWYQWTYHVQAEVQWSLTLERHLCCALPASDHNYVIHALYNKITMITFSNSKIMTVRKRQLLNLLGGGENMEYYVLGIKIPRCAAVPWTYYWTFVVESRVQCTNLWIRTGALSSAHRSCKYEACQIFMTLKMAKYQLRDELGVNKLHQVAK